MICGRWPENFESNMCLFLADIYGNPPNPVFRGKPWYGLSFIVIIVLFVVVLAIMNRKAPKEIDQKENERKGMRDNDKRVVPNQNDKPNSDG